jgi:predicted enzyme related to lactoylglutathione lyase
LAGKPVHLEIPAHDTSRAQEFYKNMFGWQFQAMEGPFEYHMTQLAEDTGGGIFPAEAGSIRVYFDVDDVKAGASRMQEFGGTADEPQPIPGMGWFVTGTDTEGNPIGLWQSDASAS